MNFGGILAASNFPLIVMTLVGGALIDRYNARILMIVSDFARAALIAVVPFAAHQSIALVYLVSVVMGTFSAWFYPSQIKMVARAGAPRPSRKG